MKIGIYDETGELAVVLPPDKLCSLMEIGREMLNDVLSRKRKAPAGIIMVRLPDSIPERMPPLKMQRWRKLWKQ